MLFHAEKLLNSESQYLGNSHETAGDSNLEGSPQVLDRALLRAGGRRWWSVLLGRARAQRMWALHREGHSTAEALRRPDNYGLASRSRFGLGRCCAALRGRCLPLQQSA